MLPGARGIVSQRLAAVGCAGSAETQGGCGGAWKLGEACWSLRGCPGMLRDAEECEGESRVCCGVGSQEKMASP